MIRYRPKWIIDYFDGQFWACRKPGGAMINGSSPEDAKARYRDLMKEWDLDTGLGRWTYEQGKAGFFENSYGVEEEDE